MRSQHIKLSLLIILVSLLLFFSYSNYKRLSDKNTSAFILIPTNASLIIQINNLDNFSQKLNKSEIWEKCQQIKYLNKLQHDIHFLDSIIKTVNNHYERQIKTVFFSTHKSSYNDAAILFTISTKSKLDIKNFASYSLKIDVNDLIAHKYENEIIYEFNLSSKAYFLSEKEGVVFGSSSKILMQDAIRQFNSKTNLLSSENFNKLKNTTSRNAIANIYYNFNNILDLSQIYIDDKRKKNIFLDQFSDWAANDIFIKDNLFFANGLVDPKNKDNFISTLENQKASENNICRIVPHNTSTLLEICLSNVKYFTDNKNIFLQKYNSFYEWNKKKNYLETNYNFDLNNFLKYIDNEIGTFSISSKSKDYIKQQFSFIKLSDIKQSSIFLSGLINEDNNSAYKDFNIYKIMDNDIISFIFGDIFSYRINPYFITIEDYLVFGNNPASLEYIIDNYLSGKTLNKSQHFKNFQQQLTAKSNLFFYANPGKIVDKLKYDLNEKWQDILLINEDSLEKFTGFAYQLNVGDPLFLNNIILLYDKEYKPELKEEWYVQLDTNPAIKPQIVSNYITNKDQIFIQDKNNKLYLFSTNGEKIWEKQITERILGNVSQIDYYKNKKLQLLFNTKNKIYIIDRLGRLLEDYPKDLPEIASNGHALFDYNNKKDYRIMIATNDGNVINIDKKGKKVKGWNFTNNKSIILEELQHFIVENKDYILYPSDNNIALLARNGKTRVNYNTDANFNSQKLQIDKEGTVYGITSEGMLWRGSLDGNTTETPLNDLDRKSKFIISQKNGNLIYTNEEKLFILDNKFNLLYTNKIKDHIKEIYTYNNNLILVSSKELYILENGIIKKGTPITTDGLTTISDLDKDNKVNIIINRDAFLYNYEIE
jgi:hypothetical protein